MRSDTSWHVVVALGNEAYEIHARVGPMQRLRLPPFRMGAYGNPLNNVMLFFSLLLNLFNMFIYTSYNSSLFSHFHD